MNTTNVPNTVPTFVGWARNKHMPWAPVIEAETEQEAWHDILAFRADEKAVLANGQRPSDRVYRAR